MKAIGGSYDGIVIGGGFFGVSIAIQLREEFGFKKVLVIERENEIMARASFNNQARIHTGYHYPRSFPTAFRSRVSFTKFLQKYNACAFKDFQKVYAIAKTNSKVSAKKFHRFCKEIEAPIDEAPKRVQDLFNMDKVEKVFLTKEYAFDAVQLRNVLLNCVDDLGIEIMYKATVSDVIYDGDNDLNALTIDSIHCEPVTVKGRVCFNCTYSNINFLSSTHAEIKHEIAEMALIELPDHLKGFGITIMDGPFFSIMPFPARSLHSFSHVEYTPHTSWLDISGINPYDKLDEYPKGSRFLRMLKDAQRYIPTLVGAKYVDSLFEVKTILLKNEYDDGRPILFKKENGFSRYYSVLGGKIDNIFEIQERINEIELCNP